MNNVFEQLKSMVVFAQVVERGSLTGAARYLGLSRAVVSYHVKKLETQLAVQLLNRTTRSISLTEAGSRLYERCRKIAAEAEAANQQMASMRDEIEGLLRITCPVNAGLYSIVPALSQFRQLHPRIELDLMLADEVVNVIQEGIDLAIRGAPLKDSGLQAVKLSSMSMLICGAPEYFRQHGRPMSPTDLAQHQWVMYKPAPKLLQLRKGERSYSIRLQGPVTTNNAAARSAFVEAGHGLGRIPRYDAIPRIQRGTLEAVLEDYQSDGIDIYAVFPPGAANSRKLRCLIDFLKDYFEKRDSTKEFL